MTSKAIFDVPPGATAQVHIIDTMVRIHGMPTSLLLAPALDDLETLPPLPAWSFLVQSSKGEKILFDLSMSPDLTSYTPAVQNIWKHPAVEMKGGKHVTDILKENMIDPSEIRSVIWRYDE
jgi:hypothetical protein